MLCVINAECPRKPFMLSFMLNVVMLSVMTPMAPAPILPPPENGRKSTLNRLLDGSIYPSEKLVPFSLNIFFVRCLEIQQLILEIGNAI
jgi:hypothetical protein